MTRSCATLAAIRHRPSVPSDLPRARHPARRPAPAAPTAVSGLPSSSCSVRRPSSAVRASPTRARPGRPSRPCRPSQSPACPAAVVMPVHTTATTRPHRAPHPTRRIPAISWVDGVLGGDRIGQDRRVQRPPPPPLQHPGLHDHRLHRVADPVRAVRRRQPAPPVHQRRRSKPPMIEREPARRLPPQITAGRLGRLRVGVIIQHLQHHHRRHHTRRADGRPFPDGNRSAKSSSLNSSPAVRGQEREHAPRRHQMPHQCLRRPATAGPSALCPAYKNHPR